MFKIKNSYYCLVAGFQDINPETERLLLNYKLLREELETTLSKSDFKIYQKLFLPFDNENLLKVLEKSILPLVETSNYTKEELEQFIKEPSLAPYSYLKKFLISFQENEPVYPTLSPENELITLFYEEMSEERDSFIRNWYQLDFNIKNILTAYFCRKHKINPDKHIIGFNETAQTIRKSQNSDFGLSGIVENIDEIISIAQINDIVEREKQIDHFKWEYLNESTFFNYFTIEKVLAFVLKTMMIERWLKVNPEYSRELFGKLQNELKSNYNLRELFTENK